MKELSLLLRASEFAAKKHKRQKRKGAKQEPYINHPLKVARLVAEIGGVTDHEVLIAAILHDTLEDTRTTEKEIIENFGVAVCEFVREVTDDKTLPKAERKELQVIHAASLSDGAKQIKLADKISNVEDIADNPPERWSLERRLDYIEWSENVVSGLRGINSALEDLFDITTSEAKKCLYGKS